MKKVKIGAPLILSMALSISSISAVAGSIALHEGAFNVDGTFTNSNPMPTTGSLDGSGLGTLKMSFDTVGNHSFTAFFDFEIDEPSNTYYNESGTANGTVGVGQSWEIDEPGYYNGDIYKNVKAGVLDNAIGTSIYGDTPFPKDDVSMAMDWDFILAANEEALITLHLAAALPATIPGFYLAQTDSVSPDTIYFWGNLSIRNTSNVPEPGSLFLLSAGLIGFAGIRRRR